jgi:protoheme IX farnesyltransferase
MVSMTLPLTKSAKFPMQKIRDYAQFLKIRLASLVVFSSGIGYAIAAGNAFDFVQFLWLILGGFLIVGASNGINQIIEKESDQLMARTANRPVATGRMSVWEAALLALLLGVAGVVIIGIFTNIFSAVLGLMSLLSYAFVYTPMKKRSPFAVFVGAFPGALPILIGYAAFNGHLNLEAGILFLVQFIWQFPHFWAIAWILHDDYGKAGFRLLPNAGEPGRKNAFQILWYTATLIPISLAPVYYGFAGYWAAGICLLASLLFLAQAWKLYRSLDKIDARKLMFGSFVYLPVVQLIYLIDKI